MTDWFLAGGWVMGFIVLVGAITLLNAGAFARFPDATRLPRIEWLCRALKWTVITGVAADLAAVGTKIPAKPEWAHSPNVHLLVLEGIAESLVPAILGGAILTVVALLTAAGHGRLRLMGTAP